MQDPDREQEIQRLVANLQDADHRTRRRATDRLGDLRASDALDALLGSLVEFDVRDEESFVNSNAAIALAWLGEAAFQRLLDMLADPEGSPQTRVFRAGPRPLDGTWRQYWVIRALAHTQDPRAIPPLLAAAERAPTLRRPVREAITRIGGPG